MHRTLIAAVVMTAGCAPAFAFVNTRMEYQVSPALAESWSSSITATPGQSIDIRVRVSYTGSASPLGLGAINFQPTVSHWAPDDAFTPIANGYSDGTLTQVPRGWVYDQPGQYGRIFGFARHGYAPTDTQHFNIGMVNAHNGATYLRIAEANVTNWQSGWTSTTGSGGIDSSQYTPGFRPTYAPDFDTRLSNIVLLKFNITLGSETDLRDMLADTPQELFGLYDTATGERQARWVANTTEPTGSIRGAIQTIPATIHVVPAPGSLSLLLLSALPRRRRNVAGAQRPTRSSAPVRCPLADSPYCRRGVIAPGDAQIPLGFPRPMD